MKELQNMSDKELAVYAAVETLKSINAVRKSDKFQTTDLQEMIKALYETLKKLN